MQAFFLLVIILLYKWILLLLKMCSFSVRFDPSPVLSPRFEESPMCLQSDFAAGETPVSDARWLLLLLLY